MNKILFILFLMFSADFVIAESLLYFVNQESDFRYRIDCVECSATLTGVVESSFKYGAPGFGENPEVDSKVEVFTLKLEDGFTVIQVKESMTKTVDRVAVVQFDFPLLVNIKDYLGKKVMVKGVLNYAVLPSHFEKIIISNSSIQLID